MYYAIGDIHGEITLLRNLYAKIIEHIAQNNEHRDTIVFLGDYIDRGENSKEVLEFLMEIKSTPELDHIFLLGNHEDMMIDALSPQLSDNRMWLQNGGKKTLKDFKLTRPTNVLASYCDWLKDNCVNYFETVDYVFCHGGLRTNIPLDETPMHVFLWKRTNNVNEYDDYNKLVVHGHTPREDGLPQVCKNSINIDTHAVYTKKLTCVALPYVYEKEDFTFIVS